MNGWSLNRWEAKCPLRETLSKPIANDSMLWEYPQTCLLVLNEKNQGGAHDPVFEVPFATTTSCKFHQDEQAWVKWTKIIAPRPNVLHDRKSFPIQSLSGSHTQPFLLIRVEATVWGNMLVFLSRVQATKSNAASSRTYLQIHTLIFVVIRFQYICFASIVVAWLRVRFHWPDLHERTNGMNVNHRR